MTVIGKSFAGTFFDSFVNELVEFENRTSNGA